jgi:hypothetical protein
MSCTLSRNYAVSGNAAVYPALPGAATIMSKPAGDMSRASSTISAEVLVNGILAGMAVSSTAPSGEDNAMPLSLQGAAEDHCGTDGLPGPLEKFSVTI